LFVRPFQYERATTVANAVEVVTAHGEGARLLAGGQSLLPMINLGLFEPQVLVDITGVEELSGMASSDTALVLGGAMRQRSVELADEVRRRQPMLAEAIRHIGNTRVRNVGTLGGSIVHNDPAAEIPLVMGVLGARYELSDGKSSRRVDAREFPAGPFETAIADGEVLVRVEVPLANAGLAWGFQEFTYRPGDFAIAAVAVVARFEERTLVEARLGITGLGSGPVWCSTYETEAIGRTVDDLREIEELATADADYVMDDIETSEYRRHLAGVLVTRALEDAFKRSEGGPGR
jgi:carbon-monoxide dehydrogenase medium subunit